MFGEFIYPTIPEKACVYFYNIICNYIFSDGNKRTGLEAGLAFLALNNFELNNIKNNDLLNFVIETASGNFTIDQCKQWFIDNTIEIM